jgi:hypothetical protein
MDAFLPSEGEEVMLNGTEGRIDWNSYAGGDYRNEEMRLTPTFGKCEILTDMPHGSIPFHLHSL